MSSITTDVLVVGGGPAGLAAAIAARQRGFAVMLADHARPPIDKACGEGLMPEAVSALERLGVALHARENVRFRGIRFIASHRQATAHFASGAGQGVRRPVLHGALTERAEEAGVELCWGARVSLAGPQVLLDGRRVSARWIIGADGNNSAVRKWSGLERGGCRGQRFGLRQHFQAAPWGEVVEVYWSKAGEAYVTPVAGDQVCVAFLSPRRHCSAAEAMAAFPELRLRLQNASPLGAPRGAITCSRRLPSVARGNVALVGEASGSLDAITGQGMAVAFLQALALGEALAHGDLGRYCASHRKLMRVPAVMERLMLSMGR
ncbi:MAG TPA: FAD-dependent monooxygenase, partial [Terriglobales bacterium]|nr:FAD-dependent monooxygenase [Terriglobales bacterium]